MAKEAVRKKKTKYYPVEFEARIAGILAPKVLALASTVGRVHLILPPNPKFTFLNKRWHK